MTKKSFLSILAVTGLAASSFVAFAAEHEAPKPLSADASLQKLISGNRRFTKNEVTSGKPVAAKRAETGQSQHPFAVVIGCADSRTSPELVFDQNIGDLFVIRTAGNLVDNYALGSIEYAVEHLGSRLIVVMGHERCGAVKAAISSKSAPGHVGDIVSDIQPAVKAAAKKEGDPIVNTVQENVSQVAAKIAAKAKLGAAAADVKIVKAYYDLDTGKVTWLE